MSALTSSPRRAKILTLRPCLLRRYTPAENRSACCKQCRKTKPWNDFADKVMHKAKDQWRCKTCQFPVCATCSKQRSENESPTRQLHSYRCDKCLEKLCTRRRCGCCKKDCLESAFDASQVQNHKVDGRSLLCQVCKSKGYTIRDHTSYRCTRCRGKFGRRHFHEHDVKNHNQKQKETLQCRPS